MSRNKEESMRVLIALMGQWVELYEEDIRADQTEGEEGPRAVLLWDSEHAIEEARTALRGEG